MGKGSSSSQTKSTTETNSLNQDFSFAIADYSKGDGQRLNFNLANPDNNVINITDHEAVKGSLNLVAAAVSKAMSSSDKALGTVERSTVQALNSGKYITDKALGTVERSSVQSTNAVKYALDKALDFADGSRREAYAAINQNTKTAFSFVDDQKDQGENDFKDLVGYLVLGTVSAVWVWKGLS